MKSILDLSKNISECIMIWHEVGLVSSINFRNLFWVSQSVIQLMRTYKWINRHRLGWSHTIRTLVCYLGRNTSTIIHQVLVHNQIPSMIILFSEITVFQSVIIFGNTTIRWFNWQITRFCFHKWPHVFFSNIVLLNRLA